MKKKKWWQQLRDHMAKPIWAPEQANIDPDPETSPELNHPDTPNTCQCGMVLETPPNTGPLAVPVCIQCDRIPKGQW